MTDVKEAFRRIKARLPQFEGTQLLDDIRLLEAHLTPADTIIPEGKITKKCGLSFVGEMGSAFYEYDGRVFVCLQNGVHEMIDGVPHLVEAHPTAPSEPVGTGEALKALDEIDRHYDSMESAEWLATGAFDKCLEIIRAELTRPKVDVEESYQKIGYTNSYQIKYLADLEEGEGMVFAERSEPEEFEVYVKYLKSRDNGKQLKSLQSQGHLQAQGVDETQPDQLDPSEATASTADLYRKIAAQNEVIRDLADILRQARKVICKIADISVVQPTSCAELNMFINSIDNYFGKYTEAIEESKK